MKVMNKRQILERGEFEHTRAENSLLTAMAVQEPPAVSEIAEKVVEKVVDPSKYASSGSFESVRDGSSFVVLSIRTPGGGHTSLSFHTTDWAIDVVHRVCAGSDLAPEKFQLVFENDREVGIDPACFAFELHGHKLRLCKKKVVSAPRVDELVVSREELVSRRNVLLAEMACIEADDMDVDGIAIPTTIRDVSNANVKERSSVDISALSADLDKVLGELDPEGSLRLAIMSVGERWKKVAQNGIAGSVSTTFIEIEGQRAEKNACFDLLDALTRSGALEIEADLHAVLTVCHGFHHNVMDTLVRDNVNPIEKIERSMMVLATKLFDKSEAHISSKE
jgi:hypothetical protein